MPIASQAAVEGEVGGTRGVVEGGAGRTLMDETSGVEEEVGGGPIRGMIGVEEEAEAAEVAIGAVSGVRRTTGRRDARQRATAGRRIACRTWRDTLLPSLRVAKFISVPGVLLSHPLAGRRRGSDVFSPERVFCSLVRSHIRFPSPRRTNKTRGVCR